MKKISSKKSLTRKVLCSIMAAGMMGVAGTAFAADPFYKTIVPDDKVQSELDEGSSIIAANVLDNVTVNVNTLCVNDPEHRDYEFIGAVGFGGDNTWYLGDAGKTVIINVDGQKNDDADVIGVLADDRAKIDIKGDTTISTQSYRNGKKDEYGVAIMAENSSSVTITGDTIKLKGDIKAIHGNTITLTGKNISGDFISLHNDYSKYNLPGGEVINAYNTLARNVLNVTADTITFKDYEGLSADGMDEKDVARDSGQPVVYVNNSDLTMNGNVTISNAEGTKVLQADPIGKKMEYYALRATDGSNVTLGKNSTSTVSITGDVVVEGLPWIDTQDRHDDHSIPTDGTGAESYLTVNGAATVNGNVVVMHGSEVTFANSANITGRIWNGIDADAAKKGEIGYINSNIADGGARKDGGILTINGGTINGTVFTGGGAETILKNVTITTDPKVENDALTIEGATAELTNTSINGGLGIRSGSLTMTGGAIKGIARSEMHDGDFEKTEIDIQTGTAELTNTNIDAVILVGMPGEDPNVYPTESSKLVLNATNDTTEYTPEYILVGPKGTLEIKGGTLVAEKLKNVTTFNYTEKGVPQSATSRDGGIVLSDNGVIETKANQIFANVATEETSGAVVNKTIDYVGGTLVLNDEECHVSYKVSAEASLKNYNAASLTEIIMTGNVIGGKTEGTLEELLNGDPDIDTDKFNANVGASNLVIGGTSTDSVKDGFKTSTLNLKEGETNSVIITGETEVVLGGSKGAENLITVDGKEKEVPVNVENGTLTIGNAAAKGDTNYGHKGNVNVTNNGNVNVNGNTTIKGNVAAKESTINVNKGALNANSMALEHANLHSKEQAAVNVKQLTVAGETNITGNVNVTGDDTEEPKLHVEEEKAKDTVINVGNSDKAGVVTAKETKLNGATLFLDPICFDGIEKGSKFATGTTALDGKYVAGRNSLIVFGEAKTGSAEEAFNATNLNWENVAAAVYLAAPITMGEKSALVVNGGLSDLKELGEVAEKSVTFADKSMLMVKVNKDKPDTVAINGASTIEVVPGSKLMLIGAEDAKVYTVFGDSIEAENEKARWAYENVISDEIAMVFVSASEKKDVFAGYKAKLDSLAAIYGDSVTAANVLDAARVDKDNKTAQEFFAAVGKDYGPKEARAKVLNNVTTITAQAGVASSAIVANAEVANAIGDHLSVGAAIEEGGKGVHLNKENGSAVWAKLIHKKADVDGLKVGSSGVANYDVKQNGIVAGLDIVNTEDKAFGVAITYMDGKVTGSAAKNDTENYGLSVYGKKKVGKAAIIADLSYIHGENDIKSGTITEKPKSDALSLGVKAETAIKAGAGQFVPYVGARVTRLGIGDYKDSIGIKHDSDVENLFNIPVGVKYSANIQNGNWTLRPTVDLGYVFNVGNKDGQETVSYGGTSNTFSYEMVDKSSFVGALGFEMENKNVAYNLGYQYTKSSSTKAHKYMLGLKVKF